MFNVGAQVRINEGRFYGQVGTIINVRQTCLGTTYTVQHRYGTADVNSVISTYANNGD